MIHVGQFSHSVLGCAVLIAALSIACKSPDSEREPEPRANRKEAKTEPEKTEPAKSEPSATEPEVVVEAQLDRPLDTALAETLIDEGRKVAAAIVAAIAAIDDHREADAKAQLATAIESLTKLEEDRPNVDIAIEIWRQGKALELTKVETVDTIPLFATVTRVDVPVYDRSELEARQEHRKGQAPASVSKAEKTADLEIIDSNLVYQEVDLPIAATEIHVLAAQELLEQNHPDAE